MNTKLDDLAFKIADTVRLNLGICKGTLFVTRDTTAAIEKMIEEYISQNIKEDYLYSDWQRTLTDIWKCEIKVFVCPRCEYIHKTELAHGQPFTCRGCGRIWWRYGNYLSRNYPWNNRDNL